MKNLLLVFFLTAAPAHSYTDTGGRFTSGPDGYSGMNVFAETGGDLFYLRPALNTYKSDSSDRISSYSLGTGADLESWSAGAELSMTPETGGYKNAGIYADFRYRLLRTPDPDAVLQDAALGVFASLTSHEDSYSTSTTTVSGGRRGTRSSSSSLTSSLKLKQTDYGVTVSLRVWAARISGRLTKTAYDKDIGALDRQLPIDIGGIGASGFPDRAASAKLRFPALPLSPEAGYHKTTYLLTQPDSESLSAGLSHKFGPAEISGVWERFNPGGGAGASQYWSLGITFSF